MKISIFGMGYVGLVSAACLLRDGHKVIGVDPVEPKIDDLSNGRSPIHEPGVPELIADGHKAARLKATTDPAQALADADMAWICVGTPSKPDGGIDLAAVTTVIAQIGRVLKQCSNRPLIVLRSTSLPGTTQGHVIPLLESHSGLTVGKDINVVFHPEFLREGTAVDDFDHPPKIVVGEAHPRAADPLMKIYEKYDAPRFRLSLGEAEMVKYCDNLFHALKVTFANEVGALAKSIGVDARTVADVFCADTKLNISDRYLRPGLAFGGSCLPKDLRAILRLASLKSLRLGMLQGLLESNDNQIREIIRRILAAGPRTVGMVGLAFKPDTDDMRESPHVKVAKALVGEGIDLKIYDPVVRPEKLIGSNKQQVQKALQHLEKLLVDSLDDLADSQLIIINHPAVDSHRISQWLNAGVRVLDLVGVEGIDKNTEGYDGLYW